MIFGDIDKCLKSDQSRTEFIEAALWAFVNQLSREEQDARDLKIINQEADRLNDEAMDVLAYQVAL